MAVKKRKKKRTLSLTQCWTPQFDFWTSLTNFRIGYSPRHGSKGQYDTRIRIPK